MKCYNCDSVIEMQKTCPNCKIRIDASEYQLTSTDKILNKINNINDFAKFIGLFYVKPIILLILSIISLMLGLYLFVEYTNRIAYVILAVGFAVAFNYFMEMRKVEAYYKDFEKNKNKYYILFPFKSEYRTIFCDANDLIPNDSIMKKRYRAYENRKVKKRSLRFNSYKIFNPQKARLFNLKDRFFARHLDPSARHVLKTNDYNDDSYVAVEGTVHGFLMMDNSVITIFNTPKLTKSFLNNDLLDVEL